MNVFILLSDGNRHGDTVTNEIKGVFDDIRKARAAMVGDVYLDLQYGRFADIASDASKPIDSYDFYELSIMFYDDPNFDFDGNNISLWEGDKFETSENKVSYTIETRELL